MEEFKKITNISIFGPSDHGKSTLIGYLFSIFKKDAFNKFTQKLENTLGPKFDHNRKYAYYSDREKTEQFGREYEREKGEGTTQHLHIFELTLNSNIFRIIDNPGHFKWKKEASKGITLGDYGVFVIDISAFHDSLDIFELMLDQDTLTVIPSKVREYVLPLFIALKIGVKLGFIVFSKMDLIEYNMTIYEDCKNVIVRFLEKFFSIPEKDISVIPTSIIASKGISDNVIGKTIEMPWYEGQNLENMIETLSLLTRESTMKPFLSVQKTFFKVSGHRLILQGKVVRGTLNAGDSVKIAPFENVPNFSVKAKIRSIHLDLTGEDLQPPVRNISAGNVAGLSMMMQAEYVDMMIENASIPYIMVAPQETIYTGDVICIELSETAKLKNAPASFVFGSEHQLLLNGKYIKSSFLGLYSQLPTTVYCFKMAGSVAAVKNDQGEIIDINPLLIGETKRREEDVSDIQIYSVKKPVAMLGYLNEISFSFPNKYSRLSRLDKVKSYIKNQEDYSILALNKEQFLRYESELKKFRKYLKIDHNYLLSAPLITILEVKSKD